ncbi:MAG: sigma-70 family RNA polymerase sigma factor [Acidobacteria bacterium]|nr:sigma-70 family RNA polymerase sigma factor [Acidobacteriota bacterium]
MTTLDPESAADLVARIVAGETAAETELIERCQGALRFLTRRYTRSEADAEDLYQETVMLALEKIRGGEVREPERLAGFLRGLAKNLGTQRYRRRSFSAETSVAVLPEPPDARRPDALGGLLHHERARLTRQILAELTVPRDREVLVRYYLAEEDSTRICDDLELTPEHFHRVLHRARQRYRRLYEERAPRTFGSVPG